MAEDEEEGPLMATGISEEEVVALAIRTGTPGPLTMEEMAIIVSDEGPKRRGTTPSVFTFTILN